MDDKDTPMPDKPKRPAPLVWESEAANDPEFPVVVPFPTPEKREREEE